MGKQIEKSNRHPLVKAMAVNSLRDVVSRDQAKTMLGTTISKDTWARAEKGDYTGVRKPRQSKYTLELIIEFTQWVEEHTSGTKEIHF